MRLFILEHGLVDRAGHHYNCCLGFKREAERRGIEALVYAHRRAEAEVVASLQARPVFNVTPYARLSPDPLSGPIEDLFEIGSSFARSCARVSADNIGRDDILFVPTAQQIEIFGVALWLERVQPERRPFVCLGFHLDRFVHRRTGKLLTEAVLYRFAAKRLRALAGANRLLFTATNQGLAELLSGVLPQAAVRFPLPVEYGYIDADDRDADVRPPADRLHVSVLGDSRRRTKGLALVPEIVRIAAAADPRLRFVVQASRDGLEGTSHGAAFDTAIASGLLDVRDPGMREDAYLAAVKQSDIVLCPYNPRAYRAQVSGVFAEAVAFGRPTVAPARTWLAEQIEGGRAAGILFPDFTAESVATAVIEAAQRHEELRRRAAELAAPWRAAECIPAYLDRLLAAARAAAPST